MKKSQAERILDALRHGDVTTAMAMRGELGDGGPPILCLHKRIEELRADGHIIDNRSPLGTMANYHLVHDEERSQANLPTGPEDGTVIPLFDTPTEPDKPRSAIYGEAA